MYAALLYIDTKNMAATQEKSNNNNYTNYNKNNHINIVNLQIARQ